MFIICKGDNVYPFYIFIGGPMFKQLLCSLIILIAVVSCSQKNPVNTTTLIVQKDSIYVFTKDTSYILIKDTVTIFVDTTNILHLYTYQGYISSSSNQYRSDNMYGISLPMSLTSDSLTNGHWLINVYVGTTTYWVQLSIGNLFNNTAYYDIEKNYVIIVNPNSQYIYYKIIIIK